MRQLAVSVHNALKHVRNSRDEDRTGHGQGFLLLVNAINNHSGYNVTVYHTFHDEVDSYRTHVWQCEGSCRQKAPFFKLVKRSDAVDIAGLCCVVVVAAGQIRRVGRAISIKDGVSLER